MAMPDTSNELPDATPSASPVQADTTELQYMLLLVVNEFICGLNPCLFLSFVFQPLIDAPISKEPCIPVVTIRITTRTSVSVCLNQWRKGREGRSQPLCQVDQKFERFRLNSLGTHPS